MSTHDSFPKVPERFTAKIVSLPECAQGAVRATLLLRDGRRIRDVILVDNTIWKVGPKIIKSESDLGFRTDEIENVERS